VIRLWIDKKRGEKKSLPKINIEFPKPISPSMARHGRKEQQTNPLLHFSQFLFIAKAVSELQTCSGEVLMF
jgi:hypothetical protein